MKIPERGCVSKLPIRDAGLKRKGKSKRRERQRYVAIIVL